LHVGEINVHDIGVTTEQHEADPIAVEHPSQEELQGVTYRVSLASELAKTNSKALNLAVVTDEFDDDTFDENVDTKQHVKEDEETARSESDEENMQPSVGIAPDAAVTPCDVPTSSRIDWGSYYTNEELRALKLKHINLQDYPNHKDISHIGSAVCDIAVINDEGNSRAREEVIK
jgi:hypothetical protein